ncbi:MAG: hypothetical protein H6825_07085 [Planctomycetes bacterium]|nr:hypothetical protein [Planctomycetota bacterium]
MKPIRSRALPSVVAVLLPALAALPGCFVLSPALPPVDPPPNIAPHQVVLQVPESAVARLSRPYEKAQRELALAKLDATDPELAAAVRERRVETGMSAEYLIYIFESHPTRVYQQGPPGGHTQGWEPGRWFVRLDEFGRVVSAGRY